MAHLSFIYGKTASMLYFDAVLIAVTALTAAIFYLLFFKEFTLICFDADFGATQGWPVARLDFFMMTQVVVVTVVGLQAVGLILVVALLIIPPSSARFWSHRLAVMLWLSAGFGALSGMLGAGISALMANLPAGAVIVLTGAGIFFFSLIFGPAGGLLRTALERYRLRKKVLEENLLREIYEWQENAGPEDKRHPETDDLLTRRSWSPGALRRTARRLRGKGWVVVDGGSYRLTEKGEARAYQVVRKHRLWEAYLITHADTAPGRVDWGADAIEHVLDETLIAHRLEHITDNETQERL